MRRMFSENQVKEMSVQAVKKGIEQGQVQVGTKLYVHNVTCDGRQELQIINTSPESLIGENAIEIFPDALLMKNGSSDYEIILAPKGASGLYFISAGAIDSIDYGEDEEVIVSDEVSPL